MYKKFTTTPQTDVAFLKAMGLMPYHKLLDIGCGGGRLGHQLINYLDVNNYYAFDKQENWIKDFHENIIKYKLSEKFPTVLLADFSWEIDESVKFDYIYAYSVFTHVGPELVQACLNNLKKHMTLNSKFYATVIAGSSKGFEFNRIHPERPHEYLQARYDLQYFDELVRSCGYESELIPASYKDPVGPGNHEDANFSDEHKILLIKLIQ